MQKYVMGRLEFIKSDIDASDYLFMTEEGEFEATVNLKRWGKNGELINFFTLSDGRKIVSNTWWNNDYLGTAYIPDGTKVALTFKKTRKGFYALKFVKTI